MKARIWTRIWTRIWRHRTKIIGALQATNGLIVTATQVLTPRTAGLVGLILGLVCIWVGIFNQKESR